MSDRAEEMRQSVEQRWNEKVSQDRIAEKDERIKELEAKLAASRIRQNRIPDRAVKQIQAADALADAVDGYLESTGCEDDSSVVDAALTAYREAGK